MKTIRPDACVENADWTKKPAPYGTACFAADEHRAVVNNELQRPTFNSKGAALAFAKAVAEGTRPAEPVGVKEARHG